MAGRPGREVTAAPAAGREGVRPGASPRSHLPPSRESPRAGPRARQCARAVLPSTAGGGGAVRGGRARARGGARRRPAARRPPRPEAAAGSEGGRAWDLRGAPGRTQGPPWETLLPGPGPLPTPLLPRGVCNLLWPREHARPRTGRPGRDTCPEAGSRTGEAWRCLCGRVHPPKWRMARSAPGPFGNIGGGRPPWRGGATNNLVRSSFLPGSHSEMGDTRDLPQKGRRTKIPPIKLP